MLRILNSNVIMKFVQLRYFFVTKYWGYKMHCIPACPKVGGLVTPLPLKVGPWLWYKNN